MTRIENLYLLPIAEVAALIRKREVSPVELVKAYLERINAMEPTVKAYITPMPDEALSAAFEAEKAINRGDYLGPLHGIPIGLKDVFDIKGVRTTLGTKGAVDLMPTEDSTAASKLRKAGAIFLGKLNMTELAFGITGENIHYGNTANPWKRGHISGGSSSGSAAATAAGECAAALGTDTGGSVRIPASLCGVVGLIPTFGRVSLRGVFPLSWSMDHVGVITRTVQDCAILLNAISGYDPQDPSSPDVEVPDFAANLDQGVQGLRIGLPLAHAWDILDDTVSNRVTRATETLAQMGASLTEVSVPFFSSIADAFSPIARGEAIVSYQDLLKSSASSLDPNVKQRVEMGLTVSTPDYIRAQQARSRLRQEARAVFQQVDLLATPTCIIAAPPYSTEEVKVGGTKMTLLDALGRLTRFANFIGLPAISVPCGFSEGGLPIGLQLIGRPFEEAEVLRAAHAYETSNQWRLHHPSLA